MDKGNSRQFAFPTTKWSLIQQAAELDPAQRSQALAQICTLYWPPVYAFIRSRGYSPHDAEDHTQSLFSEILEHDDLAKTAEGRGKLRSYLLAAVNHHLANEQRRDHQQKRGGGAQVLSIDVETAESRCLGPELVDELSPDRVFDRQWAITIMEGVVAALEQRYDQLGKTDLFHAMIPFIATAAPPISQVVLARKLGMQEQALRVAIHRLRQRYVKLVRQVIQSTLGPDASVEDEMAFLMSAF